MEVSKPNIPGLPLWSFQIGTPILTPCSCNDHKKIMEQIIQISTIQIQTHLLLTPIKTSSSIWTLTTCNSWITSKSKLMKGMRWAKPLTPISFSRITISVIIKRNKRRKMISSRWWTRRSLKSFRLLKIYRFPLGTSKLHKRWFRWRNLD